MSNPEDAKLCHFPISIFAMVMGLAGLAIAWQQAGDVLALPSAPGQILTGLAAVVFVILTGFYGLKLIRHSDWVSKELHNPVKINFFPTISISLILLGTALLPVHTGLSFGLWAVGAALQLGLTLYVLHVWVNHQHFETQHLNPAWFIPIVGNVIVPVAGVAHGFHELLWFFFSFGMIFWLVLLSIIFNRVLFHGSIPDRLLPTLAILIAPPSLGFNSYVELTGEVDAFAHILFNGGLFFTLFLATQLPRLVRLSFTLAWWAYSFPLAAMTIACLGMVEHTGHPGLKLIAIALLAVTSGLIALLFVQTVIAARRGRICLPD